MIVVVLFFECFSGVLAEIRDVLNKNEQNGCNDFFLFYFFGFCFMPKKPKNKEQKQRNATQKKVFMHFIHHAFAIFPHKTHFVII